MSINTLASVRFPTWRLMEAIVPSEYNALSDNNKGKVNMILSCGIINMGLGNATREKIFDLFPDGTTTYDNLMELLTYIPSPEP